MWSSSKVAIKKFKRIRNKFCDTTIKTNDGSVFKVHKYLLALHSQFFSKLFKFHSQKEYFLSFLPSKIKGLKNIFHWIYEVRWKNGVRLNFAHIYHFLPIFMIFCSKLWSSVTSRTNLIYLQQLITSCAQRFSKWLWVLWKIILPTKMSFWHSFSARHTTFKNWSSFVGNTSVQVLYLYAIMIWSYYSKLK